MSGRPGLQEPRHQTEADNGPIPEGAYDVDQLQYPPSGSWERMKGRVGRGTWPGLEDAWGNSRAFLKARSIADPRAAHRSGFSIHGGNDPGSAGCIDLTDGMDSFADFHRNTGQSAELNVSYPEYDPGKTGDASEAGGRWVPDGARNRRSLSLRDALRIFE